MIAFLTISLLCIFRLSWSWSNCTLLRTLTTGYVLETPTWMYPISYSACRTCPPCLITDVRQPVTSQEVSKLETTGYIAPYWEWNYRQTRTVTMVVQAPQSTFTQLQTWFAKPPYLLEDPAQKDDGVPYTYCYEHEVQYVVEEVNGDFSYFITITTASSWTTAFTDMVYGTVGPPQTPGTPTPTLNINGLPFNGGLNPSSTTVLNLPAGSGEPIPSPGISLTNNITGPSSHLGGSPVASGVLANFSSGDNGNLNTSPITSVTSSQPVSGDNSHMTSVSSERTPSSSLTGLTGVSPLGPGSTSSPTSPVSNITLSGTSSSVSPTVSIDSERTFQLFIKNNVTGLNELAVGKSGYGELVVGGVVEATILSISNETNMIDLEGNFIYFVPKGKRSSSRFVKRQNDDPTLRYAQRPPNEAVTSGFSLQNITLAANTTEGNFTFYTCSQNPAAQPIFVAELGKTPGRCFSFDLVTIPPPLNDTNTTSSTSVPTTLEPSLNGGDGPSSIPAGFPSPGPFPSDAASLSSNSAESPEQNSPTSRSSTPPSNTPQNSPAVDPQPSANSQPSSVIIQSTSKSGVRGQSSTPAIPGPGSSSEAVSSMSNNDIGQPSSSGIVESSGPTSIPGLPITSNPAGETSNTPASLGPLTTLVSSTKDKPSSAQTSDKPAPTISDNGNESSVKSSVDNSANSSTKDQGTTTPAISPSNPPNASPSIVEKQGSFANQGLYYDTSKSQILADDAITLTTGSMSVNACASFCIGYVYFGLLNGKFLLA